MLNDSEFQKLNVALVSISRDSLEEQTRAATEYNLPSGVPLLADVENRVAASYGVLEYALANGEPSHTFILVDAQGEIAWIKDYGAPDKPDRVMYVEPQEIIRLIRSADLTE